MNMRAINMMCRCVTLWRLLLVAVCIMNCSYDSCAAKSLNEQEEHVSLLEFKKMAEYDPYGALANWLPNSPHCNWSHVECNSDGNVVKLDLQNMQIQGTISASLVNLSYLTYLDLCNNSFHGYIPPQLGLLKNVEYLYLCKNTLEGTIPSTFANLSDLKVLSLANNKLHGNIPRNIDRISSLQFLALQTNNFSGHIPSSIGNLSSLQFLGIYQTCITGSLPPDIGKLKNLRMLMVFENPRLNGAIPESICNVSALRQLDLHKNAFTGYVPSQLSMLKNLNVLYLWGNSLRGNIPPSLGNCTNLAKLDFDENQLTGMIPLQLGRLPLLTFTAKSNHLVSGGSSTVTILSAVSNCSSLQRLDLSFNKLTGMLPRVFPRNLSYLMLNGNNLYGPIPWDALSRLKNLIELDLSNNKFTGGISGSVGNFKNIQRIALGNNKLQGRVPSEIGRLISSLYELSIPNNYFLGRIPDAIGNLKNLRRLVLDHNNLSGSIPSTLGECNKLELLDLSSNKFDGSIPPEVANLCNIQFYFNLSYNYLHGRLPAEIGHMIHALAIDVSVNRISGTIPASLQSCSNLRHLNLSFNEFEGSIPESLSQLEDLMSMDVSHNNISGSIPSDLQKLQMLQSLNLSFNDLDGQVPKGGSFPKFTRQSFLGNPLLCGEWAGLRPCTSGANSKGRNIALVSGVVGALLICIILFVSIYYARRCHEISSFKAGLTCEPKNWKKNFGKRFSYREISEATEGFSRNNLLGSSILSSVYKGILRDGTDVAVKLLNKNTEEKGFKTFLSECKVISMVKHRNLVKVMGVCWEEGLKALVMPLMPKGSLAEALKRDHEWLTFKQMVSIAMDIASGLEYLHHYCSFEMVHCDIKPSNILLDEDMVAHVADFGIARLLCTDSTASISSAPSISSTSALAGSSIVSISSTLALAGSVGYIPPEYGGGMISSKGDVYSFGVLLLEMVTGRSPTDLNSWDGFSTLHSWVQNSFPDRLDQVLDKRITLEANEDDSLWKNISDLIEMALFCTNESPYRRPQMTHISDFLEQLSRKIAPQVSSPHST